MRSRLVTLEGEGAVGERIIREYGAGVCLILGSYAFYDAEGRPLRYRVDQAGQKVREADGSVAVGVEGDGPVHSVEAIGTGFLADRRGFVVTNRHVVEPWWKNETAEALAKSGYEPRLLTLRAFFPRIKESLRLDLHRVSTKVDLAVLKVDLKGRKIPALPLDASGRGRGAGTARRRRGLSRRPRGDPGEGRDAASSSRSSPRRGRATTGSRRRSRGAGSSAPRRPRGTSGTSRAPTSSSTPRRRRGAAAGPVFNKYGRVIGVEYAMLPQFAGNSYGLPVRYALELIRSPRRARSRLRAATHLERRDHLVHPVLLEGDLDRAGDVGPERPRGPRASPGRPSCRRSRRGPRGTGRARASP